MRVARWAGSVSAASLALVALFSGRNLSYRGFDPNTADCGYPLRESAGVGVGGGAAVSFETLLANANAKVRERRAWLSSRHSESHIFRKLDGAKMWYLFSPVLPCPWTFEKDPPSDVQHDGGKWLCGLQELHDLRSGGGVADEFGVGKHYKDAPCVVYSMGSCNDFTFEERVRKISPGCEIHTFDPTWKESGKGKPFYDSYHGDYGFGGTDAKRNKTEKRKFDLKSIETITRELGHTHVDILKIDVEGYEWDFFDKVDWNTTKVGQILVEIHPGKKKEPTAMDMDKIFTRLENAGFYLISLEAATKSNLGQVEVVFLHKDWRPDGRW